jgi:DNA-binding MarR family transcriptional regulator
MSKPPGRPVPPAKQALLALLKTADRLKGFVAATIEPHGITAQQFNVLRILRGAEPEGLPTLTIAERMIERAPGITRMLDRLERQRLVARERRAGDRRCVHVRISRKGLALLESLDRPVDAADQAAFAVLGPRELARLTALLEKVRRAHETP